MSSNIPDDFYASVSNWYGTRIIHSSTNEILSEAQSVSMDVIGNVNAALNAMVGSGDSSLLTAIDAITALGQFSPAAIAVNYSPPGISNPGFLSPGGFTLSETGDVTVPATGAVTVPISNPPPPSIGGVPPVSGEVDFGAVPPLQTFFEPPAPIIGGIKSLGAPPSAAFTEFSAVMPTPPVFRDLVLPTFVPQPFPDYVPPLTQPLPNFPPVPNIDLDGLPAYTRIWDDDIVTTRPELGGVLVRDLITERDLRNSVETYRLRGCPLDDDLERAQYHYANDITGLMNQAESRQLIIDEGLNYAEITRSQLRFAVQYTAMVFELVTSVAKIYFEAATAQAQARLALAHALTAYYNAITAQYAADAQIYRTLIEEEVARMHYWQGLVQAEEAKVKANAQMTSLYVQTEQVETTEAQVYVAQVSTVMAQVQRYQAEIEALVAKASIAKTSIEVYKGETQAYAAGVAAYKAHFDAYNASARGVSAQNAAQQQVSEMSLADATRVAAEAMILSNNLEISASQLKAQATKTASLYESAKLTNAVEASRAQAQASAGRIDALVYSTEKQVGEIQNEAASNYAQQATRYYSQASDAAYRASEQTLKAISAATEAAAVAQEAAGRNSAALSQGALSAVHISAGLRGSGSVGGSETHSARLSQSINDSLTYTEAKTEVLGA